MVVERLSINREIIRLLYVSTHFPDVLTGSPMQLSIYFGRLR